MLALEPIGRQVTERAVGAHGVVVLAPGGDDAPGVWDVQKPRLIQALIPKPSVETLDVSILDGLAWVDEVRACG